MCDRVALLRYWVEMELAKVLRLRLYLTCSTPRGGEVTKGSITYKDQSIMNENPSKMVKKGVIQVMEGRHCFEHLTVEENLLTGSYTRTDGKSAISTDLEMVYSYFPRLKERRKSQADIHQAESNRCVQLVEP